MYDLSNTERAVADLERQAYDLVERMEAELARVRAEEPNTSEPAEYRRQLHDLIGRVKTAGQGRRPQPDAAR